MIDAESGCRSVSIIIPCFNHGQYIDEAIQSVLNSTHKNLEIVVVNDGSTDNFTNELLHNYIRPKTKVVTIPNQGVAVARNIGIQNSSAKYILPLDADDKISSTYIEDAVSILEQNENISVVCCEVECFGARRGRYAISEPTIEMLLGQNTMVVTSMFRRADFNKTKGFNPNMNFGFEDWDFWLSLAELGGEVHKLNTIGVFYRIKRGSRNATISSEQIKILRRKLYDNHKCLYSKYFFDPTDSFEYQKIYSSKEYFVGKIILKPVRLFYKMLNELIYSGRHR
jgi:glycosyltransferase involved in cell wall biosynthesis